MSVIKSKVYKNKSEVANAIAQKISNLASASKRVNIALSGGSTPKVLFELLNRDFKTIQWENIHFYWGDERCVAPDDDESNYNMTRETLLDHINMPKENIHRIEGEQEPEAEANRYEKVIMSIENNKIYPAFDLIILGMGEDGHTASIFPHQMELLSSEKLCAVAEHPVTGQKRITITGKLIQNAKEVSFLVTGKGKAERIKEIFKNEEIAKIYPAYHINQNSENVEWFLDEEAATLI